MKAKILWLAICVFIPLAATSVHAQSDEKPTASVNATLDASNVLNGVERTIYIPFKDLNATLGSPTAKIVILYKSYQDLLNQVRAGQTQAGPTVVLDTASYSVTADESVAQVLVTLKFDVIQNGTLFPLQLGDAAIGAVTAPEGVLFRGTGRGNYSIYFPKSGRNEIQLKLSARVNQSPAGREIDLICPISAVTQLDVTVPQSEQTIEITPKAIALPAEGEKSGNSTKTRFLLGSTPRIQIRWYAAASNAPEMNLLASANNQTVITIADGQVHTHTWLTYEILRGELSQVRVALPASLRLLDVNSDSRVRNWKVEKQNAGQVVTIDLVQPATKQLKIELDAEEKQESNQLQFGGVSSDGKTLGIQPLDVLRVSGQLAIRHGADLTLNTESQQGLVRIDSSEASPQLKGANALLFRFYTGDFSLSLNSQPVTPRINVTQHTQIQLQPDDLKLQETFQFNVEKIGVFVLSIRVPEGVTVDRVTGRNVKGFSISDGVLSVQLSEQTLGVIEVTLHGHRSLSEVKGEEFNLPISAPQGVEGEEGTVLVFARESIEVQTNLQAVQSAQPQPLENVARPGDSILNSMWRYSRRPVVIPVRIYHKPARLSAKVATTIDVQPEISRAKSQLTYQVELSPLNTFRFEVPESISKRLQIDVASGSGAAVPIRQKTASDPVDGRVVWTVITQRELVGQQTFTVSYDAPTVLATGSDQEAGGTLFPIPRPLGLVSDEGAVTTPLISLYGEVSLQKDRTLSVSAKPGSALEQIDNRELTLLPQNGTLAYRYYRDDAEQPASISIVTQRFEVQNVVSTIVSRGLAEAVVSEDAQATFRCRYLVQTTERQRLLLALPDHLEMLGIYINDREVKLEKAEVALPEHLKLFNPFWLNVNRPESSDSAFLLTMQFLWNIRPALGESQFGSGTLELPLPVIDVQGSGVVQELKVVVWVPEKYALVGNPERFRLQTVGGCFAAFRECKPDRNTNQLGKWVTVGKAAPIGVVQFPTEGRLPYIYSTLGQSSQIEIRWWNRFAMAIVFSGAAALIGWILLSTSWENRLGILLLFAFIAALYGLYDQASLNEAVSVGRYGLLFIVGIWVLHALLGPVAVKKKAESVATSEKVETAEDDSSSAQKQVADQKQTTEPADQTAASEPEPPTTPEPPSQSST